MDVDKDSGIATSAFVGHNLVEYTLTKDVTTYTEVSVVTKDVTTYTEVSVTYGIVTVRETSQYWCRTMVRSTLL